MTLSANATVSEKTFEMRRRFEQQRSYRDAQATSSIALGDGSLPSAIRIQMLARSVNQVFWLDPKYTSKKRPKTAGGTDRLASTLVRTQTSDGPRCARARSSAGASLVRNPRFRRDSQGLWRLEPNRPCPLRCRKSSPSVR